MSLPVLKRNAKSPSHLIKKHTNLCNTNTSERLIAPVLRRKKNSVGIFEDSELLDHSYLTESLFPYSSSGLRVRDLVRLFDEQHKRYQLSLSSIPPQRTVAPLIRQSNDVETLSPVVKYSAKPSVGMPSYDDNNDVIDNTYWSRPAKCTKRGHHHEVAPLVADPAVCLPIRSRSFRDGDISHAPLVLIMKPCGSEAAGDYTPVGSPLVDARSACDQPSTDDVGIIDAADPPFTSPTPDVSESAWLEGPVFQISFRDHGLINLYAFVSLLKVILLLVMS
eukprot:GHVH01002319.1.p1 GENE.GHVH01002319.1~~GHVH01002319.1.p1  ORF type:complete len:278 (+),score=27.25 GHVH01002319.1:446-1279(+)